MEEIKIQGLSNSKNIAEEFSNYRAFAANFEPLVIVKIGRDYLVYNEDAETSNDYIHAAQSRDYIEGWLYGAVQAKNKRFKALENKEIVTEGKTILDNDELPEFCYTYIESEQKVGIIKKGVQGYYLADVDFSDVAEGDERKSACEKFVNKQNELLEVTEEQRRSMELKSMFGWKDVKTEAEDTTSNEIDKMSYKDFKELLIRNNQEEKPAIEGVIVFTQDSFDKDYSLESRSYRVSSDNKAFKSGKIGYSIFGSALDGSDDGVRLEQYMKDEQGGSKGWKVDYCYILEEENKIEESTEDVKDFGNFYVKLFNEDNTEIDMRGFDSESEADDWAKSQVRSNECHEAATYSTENDECLSIFRSHEEDKKLEEEIVAEYETALTIANEIKRCLDEKLSDKVSTRVVKVDNAAGLLVKRKHDEDLVSLSDAIIAQLNQIGIEKDKYEIDFKGDNLIIAIEEVQVPSMK